MASAKFLEEALNTDVDESAVNAIVGSLENQLGSTTNPLLQSGITGTNSGLQQNHLNNSSISNGGTTTSSSSSASAAAAPQQKHHGTTMANGDSISASVVVIDNNKQLINNNSYLNQQQQQQSVVVNASSSSSSSSSSITTTTTFNLPQHSQSVIEQKTNHIGGGGGGGEGVKIVYSTQQGGQIVGAAAAAAALMQSRPLSQGQQLPNGTITMSPQTVLGASPSQLSQQQVSQGIQKAPTLVLKTGNSAGAPGLVTVPVNAVTQGNNQLTLQSFHGLQPGQQGALLLKTENGQYQILRVGPAPAQTANLTTSQPGAPQSMTFRMQTVQAQPVSSIQTNSVQAAGGTTTVSAVQPVVQTTQSVQRPANDNTKEKCRKFLANLLELSSKEPKSVERNVRTLIQELIDNKVEPEDFCDKLERLLNASPQPCLIGFLKKSLPLLRLSLVNNELTIDGIRPPPQHVVFSVAGATPTIQTVRVAAGQQQQQQQQVTTQQVRIIGPGAAVVKPPGTPVIQQRVVAPLRGAPQQQTRMITTTIRPSGQLNQQQQQQKASILQQQSISSSQPPALHPVFTGNNQVQSGIVNQNNQRTTTVQRPLQVRPAGQNRPVPQRIITTTGNKNVNAMGAKANVSGMGAGSRPSAKEKEKKSFSAAYTGDDDINDVAAMGGVNLAEETQKILGSTEYVGTQIRSCKEDILCSMGPLQYKIRQIMSKHGLDDPSTGDVAACISHAAQERIKDLVEKLAVITEHRLEIVKSDSRYEITNDIKGQLKFLEDLDKAERKKHEELEREMLLRAAKSRSKTEDPEQAKLKAKAKEMQRVEMEELRQREANATALQAIGPRKKPRLDGETSTNSQASHSGPNNNVRSQMPLRQRIKKVTMRDLQFLFENEKDVCRSRLLYRSYLK